MTIDNDLPVLSTEEAKLKLEKGEPIEGVHIERLAFNKKQLQVPVSIVECKIDMLDFNNSTFTEDVVIRRCDIQTLVLSEAVFEKKCDFKKTTIHRGRIQRATFKGKAAFDEAKICYTSFYQSVFEGEADFSRTSYFGEATFNEAIFKGDASFIHADFPDKALYKKTQWFGETDFKNIEIQNDIDFQEAYFHSNVYFTNSVFRLSMDFTCTTFSGRTDFAHVSVGRSIILHNLTLGPDQGFRFKNACIASILFDRETVEGHIFPEHEAHKANVEHPHGFYLEASREYAFLRTAFQQINRFDDEDWAYYQFKKCERKGQPWSYRPIKLLKRAVDFFFLDLGCGYGTKPFRTFAVSLVMVAVFAMFYFIDLQPAQCKVYIQDAAFANQCLYALDISVMALSGGYSALPSELPGSMRLAAMLEYFVGMVLLGLFVVAFSRKVIR